MKWQCLVIHTQLRGIATKHIVGNTLLQVSIAIIEKRKVLPFGVCHPVKTKQQVDLRVPKLLKVKKNPLRTNAQDGWTKKVKSLDIESKRRALKGGKLRTQF